jgi:hypothetical protein
MHILKPGDFKSDMCSIKRIQDSNHYKKGYTFCKIPKTYHVNIKWASLNYTRKKSQNILCLNIGCFNKSNIIEHLCTTIAV